MMPPAPAPRPSPATLRGRRTAPVRELVRGFFTSGARRHWSAEDIYRVTLSQHARVGINVIRRALAELEMAGFLVRRQFDHGRATFERDDRPPHDHLICLTCGVVEDVIDAEISARRAEVAAQRGFQLHHHALVLQGHCSKPGCRGRG